MTIDGYAGKYLEWSVPTDIDFANCDAEGGEHFFKSWTGKGMASDRYHQGPGQVDRVWILDVEGSRLVIDVFYMPDSTSDERALLTEVVESIRVDH